MKYKLKCVQCGYETPDFNTWFAQNQTCPQCGSKHSEVWYDADYQKLPALLEGHPESFWAYFDFLPLMDRKNIVSCREGAIPLEEWDFLEQYAKDLLNRFKHGELMHADSIHFPDSLKYKTKRLQRTVYGGGGIMPDFFVPIDTTRYSDYHRDLVARGVVIRSTTGYIERHRTELKKKYKNFESFNKKFEIDDDFMADVRAMADKEKIKFDQAQYERSLPLIKTQLKALIARDLWDMSEYFQVMNTTNESVQQALRVLGEGAYEKTITGR